MADGSAGAPTSMEYFGETGVVGADGTGFADWVRNFSHAVWPAPDLRGYPTSRQAGLEIFAETRAKELHLDVWLPRGARRVARGVVPAEVSLPRVRAVRHEVLHDA